MAQNSEGYVPFSRVAGSGASSISRGATTQAPSRGASGADFAPAPEHYAEPTSRPRPEMRPAPQGYGEPQDGYEPQASPAAVSAAQGRPVSQPEDEGVVVLSKPYMAYGEPVTRVRLRRPVTKDIKNIGNPFKLTMAPNGTIADIEIKYSVVSAYIPLLADPPLTPATVDQFEFVDLDNCAGVIAGFFVKTA